MQVHPPNDRAYECRCILPKVQVNRAVGHELGLFAPSQQSCVATWLIC